MDSNAMKFQIFPKEKSIEAATIHAIGKEEIIWVWVSKSIFRSAILHLKLWFKSPVKKDNLFAIVKVSWFQKMTWQNWQKDQFD